MSVRSRYSVLFCVAVCGVSCQQAALPVDAGEPPRLADRAQVRLADLTPALVRPVNPAEPEKLGDDVDKAVRQAEQLIEKGGYSKAIPLLEKAKASAPTSPRIHRGLGLSYAALGDGAKARQSLEIALAAAPDDLASQLEMGQLAIANGDAAGALKRFRTALLCSQAKPENPKTAEVTLRLAALLEQQRYYTAAAESYGKLRELVTTHARDYARHSFLRPLVNQPERCLLAEGKALLKAGHADRASRVLDRAYRRDKTHRDAGRLAVEALLQKGDVARAEQIVLEMVQERSLQTQAVASARALCAARKDAAVPKRLLEKFVEAGGAGSRFAIAMAEAAAKAGAPKDAADMLTKYLTGTPDDRLAAIALARLHARAGDPAAAAVRFARLLRADRIDLAMLRDELARLARRDIALADVDKIAVAAGTAEAELKPGMLCVAGVLAAQLDDVDRGVELLRRAIKAKKDFWPAYEALQQAHAARDDYDANEALLRDVIRLAGEGYFRFYLAGKIEFDRSKLPEAVKALEQARSRKGEHVPTLLLLGRAYARLRDHVKAERRLLAAFALAPDSVAAARELVRLYWTQRCRKAAGRVVARFLRDNPGSLAGKLLEARHYHASRQPERAREVLKQILVQAPDNVRARLFEVELDLPASLAGEPVPADQAKAASEKIEAILRLDPRNERALRLKAALLANQGGHAEAAKVIEPLHRRRVRDPGLAEAYLKALAKAGMSDRAAARAMEIAGRKHLGRAMRGVVLDHLVEAKRYDKAEALVEKWLSGAGDEDRPALRLRALRVFEAAKHFDKAVKLVDEWLADARASEFAPSLKPEKLRMLAQAGRIDEAVAYAKQWQTEDAADVTPKLALVAALMKAKAFERALTILDEYLQAGGDPQSMQQLRLNKLLCCGEAKKFKELVAFARQWAAQEPGAEDRPDRLAVSVLIEHKQWNPALELAREALERLEKSDPSAKDWAQQLKDARELVVSILLLAERKEQALKQARTFAAADPTNGAAAKLVAVVLVSMDREKEYLLQLEKAYKLDQNDAGINNDLGYSWADRGINLDQAERMIRRALAERPTEIAFKDSLGWVLYKQARFDSARKLFEQIADADEDELHPVILDHAADTCWRLGLKQRALWLWARAVALAEKQEKKDRETRNVLKRTPRKISDGRKGRKPRLAPLGKGVAEPAGR